MADAAAKPAKGSLPRYLQLAGDLREDILAGRFSDGTQFPTETALCERYEVSRFTVREALKRLQAEGLIARKRGSGTIVQPASARGGALHQPLSNIGELLQYSRDSAVAYAPHAKGKLPREIAVQIAERTDGTWRSFRGVRRHASDALPIAVTDAYFHESLGDAIDRLDLDKGTLFSQIEQLAGVGIGRVTQDIQAVAADAETAAALEMEKGDPVLRILRCYLDPAGKLYEISVSHHPGDRFAYAMHIDLDS
ncbi:GntR family transcriptional regulator [Paraurantiacibacter namhicola]|uniref:HTH-type transcriptional repressor YvoA n=1 Tax=Paraurantiacibacter namhicola TaxID=645517 RepID=A0A1C7D4I2_9SPHN|nr:GntR family transcriptional regulator [Paraurantiacibacter namhicola]ANU06368.1 HTH-type transcriptional repressor YvoA [Paraurantiacibacter namhicola]